MSRTFTVALLLCAFVCVTMRAASAVVFIDTVPVGDPGNGPDPAWLTEIGPLGAVPYQYRMGTFEVTNSQYAEFLNAKAASDPFALYNTQMANQVYGGITRSGASPNFAYAVKPNMGNKPVNMVSYWDAARFANWLHNGQGDGDTETGSYALNGVLSPQTAATRVRTPGATWVIPTENEWDKAAYYDPRNAAQGGPPGDDHYWTYPTQSDVPPIFATATSTGEIANPGTNVANYAGQANWNGSTQGGMTTVGSAGPLSTSFYGTYDQAGNVGEWTLNSLPVGQAVLMGGSFFALSGEHFLTPLGRNIASVGGLSYSSSDLQLGFRLALVPEPSTLLLSVIALAGFAAAARRRSGDSRA
jgi:hypothetical protein